MSCRLYMWSCRDMDSANLCAWQRQGQEHRVCADVSLHVPVAGTSTSLMTRPALQSSWWSVASPTMPQSPRCPLSRPHTTSHHRPTAMWVRQLMIWCYGASFSKSTSTNLHMAASSWDLWCSLCSMYVPTETACCALWPEELCSWCCAALSLRLVCLLKIVFQLLGEQQQIDLGLFWEARGQDA